MENLNTSVESQVSAEAARSFFTEEGRVLSDIAGGSGFTFQRGEGWAINPETGEATYDPKFFEEKGYTPSQALFAAFHEIDHVTELAQLLDTEEGKKIWEALKAKKQRQERTHLLWNFVTRDPADNKRILGFAPAMSEDMIKLYQEKLFPKTDFRDLPLHLQLIHAILRKSMLSEEDVLVDPKVAEAIEAMQHTKTKGGEEKDVIDIVTNPTLALSTKIKLVERFIEPAYESLFQEDVKNQQNKPDEKDGQQDEKPFKPLYKKLAEQYPSPLDEEEVEKKIRQTQEQQSEGARQKAGYEAEHGVSQKDIADYAEEYRKIEKYIEPLRQIFRRIIEQRKIPVRHLAALKEEGVMIDSGLVAQTFMDVKAGIENPKTMKDFEGTLIDENVPTNFEITIVADRTSSMKSGTKIPEQRRSSILLMEALKEFSDMTEDQGPLVIDLGVRSEVLSFGDNPQRTEVLKPLSKELTERQRVGVFKSLAIADSGRNNEEVMLANILASMQQEAIEDPTYLDKIKSGKLRKFVIILTDGIVGNLSATRVELDRLRGLGVVVAGVGMTRDGGDAVGTYAPNGRVCYDVGNLPKTLEEMLSEYLGSLSIDGNPQTVLHSDEEV